MHEDGRSSAAEPRRRWSGRRKLLFIIVFNAIAWTVIALILRRVL